VRSRRHRNLAVKAHGEQKRPAGEPYAERLLEVVEILVSGVGVRDEDLLVAAVLHDVVGHRPHGRGGR
jgi:guanosine-3',5'-bis(diphosphate) 3'-pyrophosphohydrolase